MHFAFLFPGQGSQYQGMGKEYLREFPYIQDYFLEANEILNFDIFDLCLNGPEEKLNLTFNAQPSILILSYCAFQILHKEYNAKPFLMAGHSLGEISALCCSGAISFPDALKIVRKRGELMQTAVNSGEGTMAAVNGLSLKEVQDLCNLVSPKQSVVIANINSANQIVISGRKEGVEAVGIQAKLKGAVSIPLKVSAPFHSPFMKPAVTDFESELDNYTFTNLKYPVISNVTCKPYMNENEIIPLLTDQITSVVNWQKIMEYISKTKVNAVLELPPKRTLTKFFQNYKSQLSIYSFDQIEGIKDLLRNEVL